MEACRGSCLSPGGKDYQTAHEQDELYIVVKGSGTLIREGSRYPFHDGDALFVAAGEAHSF
jgi:mannose-6-phosphate isomerase-like protein (cupin superfamily)